MGVIRDKVAYNKYMREYNKKNPEKRKHGDLKKKYNISYQDYKNLLDSQLGLCKICSLSETQLHPVTNVPYLLSVDHCHKTGKVRGLLCNRCNRTLGMVNDNTQLLTTMINYLEKD